MRTAAASLGLALLVVGAAAPARAQFVTDARRVALGGLSLNRDGSLRRFNAAYRAVPKGSGQPKLTIPIPLGLLQALGDSEAFDVDSSYWNPVRLVNYLLNPPLFHEVKRAPTPTNDVEFTIGRNQLIIDLGEAQALIPSDEFGFGSSGRLLDLGIGLGGFRVGVMAFLQYEAGFTLGNTLRAFLKEAAPAQPRTRYNAFQDGQAQFGFAPTLGFSGRLLGDDANGVYLGLTARYYLGVGYAAGRADAGFTTDTAIFGGQNPATPDLDALTYLSEPGHGLGTGFGGDVGLAWIRGPLEVGIGVNDVGATLTWDDVRIERHVYDATSNTISTTLVDSSAEAKTRLPASYLVNASYRFFSGLTVGATVLDQGRGATVHLGGEQRFGPLAVRAGLNRDERQRLQYGWGGGLRFGPLGLDVGFWTHSHSFSNARGVTMATSLSIY